MGRNLWRLLQDVTGRRRHRGLRAAASRTSLCPYLPDRSLVMPALARHAANIVAVVFGVVALVAGVIFALQH